MVTSLSEGKLEEVPADVHAIGVVLCAGIFSKKIRI
jgi:hypothetical protein